MGPVMTAAMTDLDMPPLLLAEEDSTCEEVVVLLRLEGVMRAEDKVSTSLESDEEAGAMVVVTTGLVVTIEVSVDVGLVVSTTEEVEEVGTVAVEDVVTSLEEAAAAVVLVAEVTDVAAAAVVALVDVVDAAGVVADVEVADVTVEEAGLDVEVVITEVAEVADIVDSAALVTATPRRPETTVAAGSTMLLTSPSSRPRLTNMLMGERKEVAVQGERGQKEGKRENGKNEKREKRKIQAKGV